MGGERRVAVITGAGSGIGRAIAHRLGRDAFDVVVADIDDAAGEAVVKELEQQGAAARFVHFDVANLDEVNGAANVIGPVDVLVNNAGFDKPGFFLESDPSGWERLIAVNLTGVINCTYAFAPVITERCKETGYGRIVNVASDAGRVGALGEAVYAAAKGGVIAFTKSMARELARDKVTVNAVCPGPADTPMTDEIRTTEFGEKLMQRMVRATPLRRLVAPEEVAAATAYFLSDDAGFTTAQALSTSGGLTIPG